MSRASIELDFLGLEKKHENNNASKPKFQKFLHRRRSFREIQGAISKIDPEIIKSLLASGPNHSDSSTSYTSNEDQTPIPISPVHTPLTRPNTEIIHGTLPMTIFYNGTVSVFQVSPNKAENILKVAMEISPKKDKSMEKDLLVIPPTTLRPKLFGQTLEGDLPIARRKSLQRFLEKRKERLISTSPYSPTST